MINYTIEDFNIDANDLAIKINTVSPRKQYDGIYGIPKGGIALAIKLSEQLSIPLIELNDIDKVNMPLIVDDLVDSGATRKKFSDYDFACIHIKKNTPKDAYPTHFLHQKDEWIQYWWEGNSSLEDNFIRILEYIGEDPNREGLLETPNRIVKAYETIFSGYKQNAKDLIKTFSESNYDEMVLLKNIELYSMCEHHMLPFIGKAHVAYIPNKRVIGISKLARIVDMYAKRLQIQERLCDQVTECLMKELDPLGAACVIEAEHLCMRMRGVEKQNSVMITSSLKGSFKDKQATREEFMRLIKD